MGVEMCLSWDLSWDTERAASLCPAAAHALACGNFQKSEDDRAIRVGGPDVPGKLH